MTMFRDVNHRGFPPAEDEVADACSQHNSETQPHIVGHEDEHQEVADDNLDDMQHGLNAMCPTQHFMLFHFVHLGHLSTGSCDGDCRELDGGNILLEKIFSEVFEALVEHAQQEDANHRSNHSSHS